MSLQHCPDRYAVPCALRTKHAAALTTPFLTMTEDEVKELPAAPGAEAASCPRWCCMCRL